MESSVEIVRHVPDEDQEAALGRSRRRQSMREFGVWLKQRGISQTFAAGRMHLHRGHLSNLIAGKHIASDDICKAARAFMVVGDESSPRAPQSDSLTSEAVRVVSEDEAAETVILRTSPVQSSKETREQARVFAKEIEDDRPPRHYRRPLCAAEIAAVGSIVKTVVEARSEMTFEELVSVTEAAADGFRSTPRSSY